MDSDSDSEDVCKVFEFMDNKWDSIDQIINQSVHIFDNQLLYDTSSRVSELAVTVLNFHCFNRMIVM